MRMEGGGVQNFGLHCILIKKKKAFFCKSLNPGLIHVLSKYMTINVFLSFASLTCGVLALLFPVTRRKFATSFEESLPSW